VSGSVLTYELTVEERVRLRAFARPYLRHTQERLAPFLALFAGAWSSVLLYFMGSFGIEIALFAGLAVGLLCLGVQVFYRRVGATDAIAQGFDELADAMTRRGLRCRVRMSDDGFVHSAQRRTYEFFWHNVEEWTEDDDALFLRDGRHVAMVPMRAFDTEAGFADFRQRLESATEGDPTWKWVDSAPAHMGTGPTPDASNPDAEPRAELKYVLTAEERAQLREFGAERRKSLYLWFMLWTYAAGMLGLFAWILYRTDLLWAVGTTGAMLVFGATYFAVRWKFGMLAEMEAYLALAENRPVKCTVRVYANGIRVRSTGWFAKFHEWEGITDWGNDDEAAFIQSGIIGAMIPARAFASAEEFADFVELLELKIESGDEDAPWIST
jgi:hypothetical protein